MDRFENFINGKFVPAANGKSLPVYEPATGKQYAEIPDSDGADIAAAVGAAKATFPAWAELDGVARGQVLEKIARGIEDRLDELVAVESRDQGKPESLARRVDIPRAALNFRFYAAAASQFASESHPAPGALNVTLRNPVGVAGCIAPWNLPLYLLSWKLVPALAAGCTVVAKPSEWTPASAALLGEIARDAGLPDGVLNIVQGVGERCGKALVEHPDVPAISFTGGTATGADIARRAGPMFKKLSLELGGKNPTLVFADANFDQAVAGALRAAFSNQGEICLCGSRILVERPISERFRDAFVAGARKLEVGDPRDPNTDVGAIVSREHYDKVLGCLETARKEGANILCGGEALKLPGRLKDGWFISPAVIEGLGNDSRTNQEEIFGPAATLIAFDGEAEALALANDVRYGLAASLWTENLGKALRVSEKLQAGLIWVNCWMLRDLRTPMGGVKDSGVGHEGGFETMRFFTDTRNLCLKY
ncbi:MAG: aldehyde dehydrogenase [Gammaproteobacteria bacterium]|nr:aldehyde dehydrogenase [Gammaproteobacteria bacterium]